DARAGVPLGGLPGRQSAAHPGRGLRDRPGPAPARGGSHGDAPLRRRSEVAAVARSGPAPAMGAGSRRQRTGSPGQPAYRPDSTPGRPAGRAPAAVAKPDPGQLRAGRAFQRLAPTSVPARGDPAPRARLRAPGLQFRGGWDREAAGWPLTRRRRPASLAWARAASLAM